MSAKEIWGYVKHYFYGCFAKSFNGGIVAMDAFIGLSVGAALSVEVAKPNWQAALAVFAVSFGRSALMYFRDHPIPEKLPESTTVTTAMISTTETKITPATP